MEKFEKSFEDMDVRSEYMEGKMQSTTAMSTPADQVDNLLQEIATANGLEVGGMLDNAGPVGSGVPEAEKAEEAKPGADDLEARLAALRK
jgi:charged multivesicular body protein 1